MAGLSKGVPTNPIAVEPSHVAVEEGSIAAMFWSLLARAGYDVWLTTTTCGYQAVRDLQGAGASYWVIADHGQRVPTEG